MTTTKSINKGLAGLSAVPVLKYVQERGRAAGFEATRHTPFAFALEGGVAAEKTVRAWLDAYRDLWARFAGVASRQEVRRLRELVRALEYRLECLEQAPEAPRPGATVEE